MPQIPLDCVLHAKMPLFQMRVSSPIGKILGSALKPLSSILDLSAPALIVDVVKRAARALTSGPGRFYRLATPLSCAL